MAMSFPLPTFTVDMVRAFPDDGQRYELVEGVLLVTPAPASDHQIVISRLMTALNNYLGAGGPAYAVSPAEIEVAPKLHLEPDVLVFPSTFRPGTRWTEIDEWWLAVEALSPRPNITTATTSSRPICTWAPRRSGSWTWIGTAARSLAWTVDARSLNTGTCAGIRRA